MARRFKLPKKGRRKNTTKNKRAGKTFVTSTNKKGQKVHTYNIGGKRVSVVVKPKKKGKGKGRSLPARKPAGTSAGGQFTAKKG